MEKGWSLPKKYKDCRSALDSLSDCLKVIREQKASQIVKTSLTPEMTDDSMRGLEEDIKNKRVFYPTQEKGIHTKINKMRNYASLHHTSR